MSESKKSGRGSLIAGGIAAALASACCLGPVSYTHLPLPPILLV